MGVTFNGTQISAATYNGTSLTKITYNGVEVWSSASAIDYLCFTSSYGSDTVSLSAGAWTDIETSTDKETWTTYTAGSTKALTNAGDKIYFRGNNDRISNSSSTSQFTLSGGVEVSGDVTTLLSHNGGVTTLPSYCFFCLFKDTQINNPPSLSSVVTAGDLSLASMFSGCTFLRTPPNMDNLTTVGEQGCGSMFRECSAMDTAPNLSHLTTIGNSGCINMFYNCSSMTSAINLTSVSSLGNNACQGMFYDCKKITNVDGFSSVTTIPYYACRQMFYNCYKLDGTLNLNNVTTIGDYGCASMYENCTTFSFVSNMSSLRVINGNGCNAMFKACIYNGYPASMPSVHTIGVNGCYEMYFGNSTMITVPILSATTINLGCYGRMFMNCTNVWVCSSSSSSASRAWTIPNSNTFVTSNSQSNVFTGCAGTRSSNDIPCASGMSYTYYTRNAPV